MQRPLVWSIIALCCLALASAAPITVEQSHLDAGIIAVPIELGAVTDLAGFSIDVTYDTTMLTYHNATLGPLLSGTGQQFFSLANTSNGTVSGLIAVQMSAPTGVTGTGEILTLRFVPQSLGQADVSISAIQLSTSTAQPIAYDVQDVVIVGAQQEAQAPAQQTTSRGGGGGGGGGGRWRAQEEAVPEPSPEPEQPPEPVVTEEEEVPSVAEVRTPENVPAGLGITAMASTPESVDGEVARPVSTLFIIISIVSTLLVAGVMHRRVVVRRASLNAFRENGHVIVAYIHDMWRNGWTNDHLIESFLTHAYPEEIIIEMMERAYSEYEARPWLVHGW